MGRNGYYDEREYSRDKNYDRRGNDSAAPVVLAFLVTLLMIAVVYHKEIIHWLYVHEMWLIPIQINY